MLSVVERARPTHATARQARRRCEDVCFLLFPVQIFPKVIFSKWEAISSGRRPTDLEKSCCRGDTGWFEEGFLWCGQNECSSAGHDFAPGARAGVENGLVLMAWSAEVEEQSGRSASWGCGSKAKQEEIGSEGLAA